MLPCECDELLEDHQLFHSDFQIDNFIIGSQPTPWSRYKQAMRELAKRAATLKELSPTEHGQVYVDAQRECDRFARHVRDLKALLGPLTPERREQYERDDWQHKAVLLALEDYVDRGRLSWRTISFVLTFPRNLRQATWAIISDRAGLYRLCEADYGLRLPALHADLPFVRKTAIIGSVRSLVSDKEKDDGRQKALELDGVGSSNRRIDAQCAARTGGRTARPSAAPEGERCHGH